MRIEELRLSPNSPTLRLRFDLAEVPTDPPATWLRDGLDVVQIELAFGGVRAISIDRFSTDSVCHLRMRKGRLVDLSRRVRTGAITSRSRHGYRLAWFRVCAGLLLTTPA